MANIKQQKKRIGIAQRQRLENLRYKSAAKTLLRNLQDAVNLENKELAESAHKSLVSLLDRAAARNVLHRNTVARKKARASRVLISEPVKAATVIRKAKKKTVARKPKADAAVATETKKATTAKPKATKATAAPAKAEVETPVVEETPAAEAAVEETPAAEAVEATEAPAEETTEAPAEDAPAEDA